MSKSVHNEILKSPPEHIREPEQIRCDTGIKVRLATFRGFVPHVMSTVDHMHIAED